MRGLRFQPSPPGAGSGTGTGAGAIEGDEKIGGRVGGVAA